jgi:hypothetical protein
MGGSLSRWILCLLGCVVGLDCRIGLLDRAGKAEGMNVTVLSLELVDVGTEKLRCIGTTISKCNKMIGCLFIAS